jgi:pSer/pThr/pTyr-binding forkhead associated (FHA) protein
MTRVTLRVLDGADRGRAFADLETPITIGREEGNIIQLNDERVSRFHAKVQADHAKLVLTDLESTNGTKVNGEDVRLRVLRFGDLIQIGRSMLIVGTREQIEERLSHLPRKDGKTGWFGFASSESSSSRDGEAESPWRDCDGLQDFLFNHEPPELPEDLDATQSAQFAELLGYLHLRLRALLNSVRTEKGGRVSLDATSWQKLTDLQSRLAEFLRVIGEPEQPE